MKADIYKRDKINIYVCISLTDLLRVNSIHNTYYSDYDKLIIFSDYVIKLPIYVVRKLKNNLEIIYVEYGHKKGKITFFWWKRYAEKIIEIINQNTENYVEINLMTSHDNWAFFPTLLEEFKRKIVTSNAIMLFEDGLALYEPLKKTNIKYSSLKKMVFRIIGLSPYCYEHSGIGWNPILDAIYCQNPNDNSIICRVKYTNSKAIYEGNTYSIENILSLLQYVGIEQSTLDSLNEYDCIFLSAPMEELTDINNYLSSLKKIFKCLDKRKILIKKHPRDSIDYDNILPNNVSLCDKSLDIVPVECLLGTLRHIDIISFCSSACLNPGEGNCSFFLYRLLKDSQLIKKLDSDLSNYKKVTVINDFCELKSVLNEKRELKDENFTIRRV